MSAKMKIVNLAQSVDDQPIVVGVDDGFAITKVVVLKGGKVEKSMSIPSRARAGVHGTTNIGEADESAPIPCYETEGLVFTVGDLADAESAKFNEYPFSGMNRVIVNHALRMAGLSGKECRIATGLPLSMFYKGAEPNSDIISRKNISIREAVTSHDKSPMPIIIDHSVFPEGLAAWVDYAVDESGNLVADLDETVGVIDIGGRTTDIAVVLPGKRIDHARCGSADMGVLNVVEEVRVALLHSKNIDVPTMAIERALRSRSIKVWGKLMDIGEIVDAAVAQISDSIMREVDRRLGTAIDIDKILLVGGGAHLFARVAAKYPNIVIPDEPEFANARGFAKYLNL